MRTALRAVAVRVPGSSANLGAGFDCVGMAVGLYLDAAYEPGPGPLEVVRAHGAASGPPGADLVAFSFRSVLEARGVTPGGVLRVDSGIPVSRGLGSSAAALVAGAALAGLAAGDPLESAAATAFSVGSAEEGHGDNVASSAFGGLAAVVGGADGYRAIPLRLSRDVGFAFAAPPTHLATGTARAALPASVPHAVAVAAIARAAALIQGLASGDPDLLRRGFQDTLHVPYRLPLIPAGEEALAAAEEAGAWAGTVSGAGSGLIAVCPPERAAAVADAMGAAFTRRHGEEGTMAFRLHPEAEGVRMRGTGVAPSGRPVPTATE